MIAAVAASSSTALTDACGASISASAAALPSLAWYWRRGEGIVSVSSRRVPARMFSRCASGLSSARRPTVVALVDQRRIGAHRLARCPGSATTLGIVPNVHVVWPVRSSLRVAAASAARSFGRTCSRSALRSCPEAITLPCSSSTLNVIFR